MIWVNTERPGYFGRHRDQRIAQYNARYGFGNWRITHVVADVTYDFLEACQLFYEESYYCYLANRPEDVDFICQFGECIDNAPSNIQSGCDYEHQEAYSTHIQDIAVRNVLKRLGRWFTAEREEILVIRSSNTNGYRFSPGNIPFYDPALITQPEIRPRWAGVNSTEAFWQSNKVLQVKKEILDARTEAR
jgi:hypothetical protein